MNAKYPKGQYIVCDGERRKVLEELGELRFLSLPEKHGFPCASTASSDNPFTVDELERNCWEVEEVFDREYLQKEVIKELMKAKAPEPWKPKDDEMFFFVTDAGGVDGYKFLSTSEFDTEYVAAGNCYRTREDAEKAAERVRKAYKE